MIFKKNYFKVYIYIFIGLDLYTHHHQHTQSDSLCSLSLSPSTASSSFLLPSPFSISIYIPYIFLYLYISHILSICSFYLHCRFNVPIESSKRRRILVFKGFVCANGSGAKARSERCQNEESVELGRSCACQS